MVSQNLSEDLLKPEAEKYLTANFHGATIDATITDFDLDLSDDETIVTLEAEATLPTTFMRIFGQNQMEVSARSEITREMTGLEVALVLDVTGSMDDPVKGNPYDPTKKIAALRTAGVDLVNILFGDNDEVDDLWVGVVPFSQSVNIGTEHADWMEDLENYTDKIYCVGPDRRHAHSAPAQISLDHQRSQRQHAHQSHHEGRPIHGRGPSPAGISSIRPPASAIRGVAACWSAGTTTAT